MTAVSFSDAPISTRLQAREACTMFPTWSPAADHRFPVTVLSGFLGAVLNDPLHRIISSRLSPGMVKASCCMIGQRQR